MNNVLLVLLSLLSEPVRAIEPGLYTLVFRSANDVIDVREIEILEISSRTNTNGSFDVKVSSAGGSKFHPLTPQLVRGIYYDEKFTFIIPFAHVVDVTGFKFIGDDKEIDSKWRGKVHIIGQGERQAKEGPFGFWMQRGPADQVLRPSSSRTETSQ